MNASSNDGAMGRSSMHLHTGGSQTARQTFQSDGGRGKGASPSRRRLQTQMQPLAKGGSVLHIGIGPADLASHPFGVRCKLEDAAGQGANQLARRTGRQQAAGDHEAQPGAADCLIHVGRAHDHPGALRQQADDQLPEVLPRDRVHAAGRFVQQQERRTMDQRTGQPQLLFHAARKRAGPTVLEPGQPDETQQLARPVSQGAAFDAPHRTEEHQVFIHRQVAVERETLGQIADTRAGLLGMPGHIVSQDVHRAAFEAECADHQPHGCGLARAVGPDQPVGFTGLDGQREAVNGGQSAEVLVQVGRFQEGHRRLLSECDVGGHARLKLSAGIGDGDLDRIDDSSPPRRGLDVARGVLAAVGNALHRAGEGAAGE